MEFRTMNHNEIAAAPKYKGLRLSSTVGLVAHAGGGQTLALPLPSTFNKLATVGTAADSVLLPPAKVGEIIVVQNSGANSANVFPYTGDIINALSANTALAVAAAAVTMFFCLVDGTWASK